MITLGIHHDKLLIKPHCLRRLRAELLNLQTVLDRKRAKALEEYNQEMTRISKIAGGARSMAEERKYNDENKIKEKARKIRSTWKPPRTCACFWE
jgi:hypothetical protein